MPIYRYSQSQQAAATVPFCARCRAEYVANVDLCDDCGAPLVDELPVIDATVGDAGELVKVWRAQGEMEGQLIRALLEGSGIESMLSGEALRLTHGLTVDGLAEVRILVREEDVTKACEIIATMEDVSSCPDCGFPVRVEDARCQNCNASLPQDPDSEGQ